MNKAEKWSVFITYANGDPIEQKLEFIDGPEKSQEECDFHLIYFQWYLYEYVLLEDLVYVHIT